MKTKSPKPIQYRPIRRVIRMRLLVRWGILLSVAGLFVLLYSIAAPHCDRIERGLMQGMSVGIYLYIFYKSHVLPRTFSREWTGRILSWQVNKRIRFPKGPVALRIPNQPLTTYCKWTISKDSRSRRADGAGGEAEDIVDVEYDTDDIWEGYFTIGERVRLYKNATYIVKAHPPRGEENLLCPLCGLLVLEPRCPHCRVDFTEEEEPKHRADISA